MDDKTQEFLNNLAQFCSESMLWCAQESETSILKINEVLSLLMEEASRVSAVSKETLEAVESMREIINSLAKSNNRQLANELAKALTETAHQNEQIHFFVSPIIETLQFQDRITQNMQNFGKMIKIWLEKRTQLASKDELNQDDLRDFGEKLLTCTTMGDERELIRSKISGLKEEEQVVNDVLFF